MIVKSYCCEFTVNDKIFYACSVHSEMYVGTCVFNSVFDRACFLNDLYSSLSKYFTRIDIENNRFMDQNEVKNILSYYFDPVGLVSNIKDKRVFIKRC